MALHNKLLKKMALDDKGVLTSVIGFAIVR